MCVNKLLWSYLAFGINSRSSTWNEWEVNVYTLNKVCFMDVVKASTCFKALSLSKLVAVVVFSVLATNAGSFVSNKFSISLSKSSGACHGESNSIGLYNNIPWTFFLVLVCAPATDAVRSGAKRCCMLFAVSPFLSASCTADKHMLVIKYFHCLKV